LTESEDRALGRIEAQIASLSKTQDAHHQANREDHADIKLDLGGHKEDLEEHNNRVVGLIVRSKADRIAGDERHNRLWSIMMLSIGIAVAALGALSAFHISE
jgi:hypothetical protein